MDNLVPVSDLGVIVVDDVPKVSSRKVAEMFGREHKTVLAAIENAGCSKEFGRQNFEPTSYKDQWNRKQPEYLMTRDGFTFLAMGFTGKKAAQFKEAYIHRFNEMEQFIESRSAARLECRELTDMIQSSHDEPKFYHFTNEFDLINRLVLGMTAKQFLKEHGLSEDAPVRDHLTPWQIEAIQRLQKFDSTAMMLLPDYQDRKKALQTYFELLRQSLVVEEGKRPRMVKASIPPAELPGARV